MNDQNFHEIQLSGKQLLFGFMSAVVLLVVIFLLGVSVGRGVRPGPPTDTTAAASPAAPGDTTVSTTPPPGPKPGDLNYPAVLKNDPATPPPPAPATQAPPATPPPSDVAKAADPQQAKTDPPPPVPKSEERTAAKGAPPADGWFAQVGAYGARRAADAIVADLRSKGFDAKVYPFQNMFRVRIGPFATNAEAEQTRQRLLKAGHKSTVIR